MRNLFRDGLHLPPDGDRTVAPANYAVQAGIGVLYSSGLARIAIIFGGALLLNRILAIIWGQEQLST